MPSTTRETADCSLQPERPSRTVCPDAKVAYVASANSVATTERSIARGPRKLRRHALPTAGSCRKNSTSAAVAGPRSALIVTRSLLLHHDATTTQSVAAHDLTSHQTRWQRPATR